MTVCLRKDVPSCSVFGTHHNFRTIRRRVIKLLKIALITIDKNLRYQSEYKFESSYETSQTRLGLYEVYSTIFITKNLLHFLQHSPGTETGS